MKRNILFAVALFALSVQALAQIEVESFRPLPMDQTARITDPVIDQNGYKSALIKVVTTETGFSWDAGLLGITDIVQKVGEIWVYVPKGSRKITIKHEKHGVLRNYNYPDAINEASVYEMILKTPEDPGDMLPVTFMVTPADASLSVDGRQIKNEVPVELEIGEHRFVAERENYQTINKNITVDKQHVLFRFEMDEVEDVAIRISSRPSEATVYLDGVRIGQTPLSTFYPAGNYPVRITKPGFVSIEDEYLEVKAPMVEKNYVLDEDVGYLTIKTRPEAHVYFNGNEVEANKRIKLTPQLVKVKVEMAKAATIEENVVIKRKDDKTLELYPEIQTGTIQVAVTPFDAHIELSGDGGEHYTADGMKIFNDIPVGTYQLKVSKDGYKTEETTLTLSANDKITQSIKLEEGPDVSGDMVFVKGGCFDMGQPDPDIGGEGWTDDEQPVHRVCVDDFYIGKYEVTQKQWKEIMGNNPSYNKCDDCPVERVSWNDVQEFIKKLNEKTGQKYRLPTEAEWEYAARGGNQSNGYQYSGSNNLDEVGWYWRNSGDDYLSGDWNWDKMQKNNCKTHKVGQKKANELGIYDMSGNVREWCSDWYGSDYYGSSPERNPQGPQSGKYRILRGGSWFNYAFNCRVAYRNDVNPLITSYINGFRFVQD